MATALEPSPTLGELPPEAPVAAPLAPAASTEVEPEWCDQFTLWTWLICVAIIGAIQVLDLAFGLFHR